MDKLSRIGFDRTTALLLAVFLLPILVVRAVIAKRRSGRILDKQQYHGINGSQLVLFRFAGISRGRNLARLFNIIRGELAWVGPTPVPLSRTLSKDANACLKLRPGYLSVWRLRRLTGSKYESDDDPTQYPNHSLRDSITIIVRYIIARALASNYGASRPDRFTMLGVEIDNITIQSALERIRHATEKESPQRFAFVNPDCLNKAVRDEKYQAVLANMNTVFADGIGIRIGCRMLGINLRDNVNGTDLFPLLCEEAAKHGKSLYLLGGQPSVADAVATNMQSIYPDLKIAGTHNGFFDKQQEAEVIEQIANSGADILLVAFGAPKQELWIDQHCQNLAIPLQIGVGGLFDFYSGRISRSPRWLRDVGLEWTWRLLQEPGRMWRRYVIGNPLFLYRVSRQSKADPRRKILKRFSSIETGFFKASLRFHIRHFCWTFALFTGRAARRLLDIVVSLTALLMASPVLLTIALIIKVESPGPVIFAQTRVGRWGKYFTMYKFRSMCLDAERKKEDLMDTNEMDGGVIFKMKEDPRITKIGKFIRKYSIDELPQFWNVLMGDMSLVGPRPPVPSEVDQYSIQDRRRLEIKPGITCIWQVSGRSNIAFEEQVELDVDYIESHGFLQDIKILLKTIPAVVFGKGSY